MSAEFDDIPHIHSQLAPGIPEGHHLRGVVDEYTSTVTGALDLFVSESGFPHALEPGHHRRYPQQAVHVRSPLIGSETAIDTGSIVVIQHLEVPLHPYGIDDLVDSPQRAHRRGFAAIAVFAGNVVAEFSHALIVPFETDHYGLLAAAEGVHRSLNTPPTELK